MSMPLIVIALVIFALSYFSKRRYGLPALALVAGSVMSSYWSSYVTMSLQLTGIVLVSPPLGSVVSVGLVLLPALLLLTVGPTYPKKYQRIVGSLLFTILAMSFVFIAVAKDAPQLVTNDTLVQQAKNVQPIILVLAIIAAISDSFIHHLPKKSKKLK